jgi:hypothetical protein
MSIFRFIVIGVAAAFLFSQTLHAKDADDYNSTNLPSLPDWAGLYKIDLESISPDQNWAVLVPKDAQTGGNYLVHLPDFAQLFDLPTIGIFDDGSREGGLIVHWAKDSSAAVAFTSGKFGAESIFIVVPGSPGYIIDLEHEIRREMQADFQASKAEPWNGNFDYYLDDGAANSWTINNSGRVIVDCQGDSNPRQHLGRISWIGHFQGLYDIRTEKFTTKSYKRIFCGKYGQ